MANGNNTASIGFEQQIWAAADILRGNMDAAEYKHVVLGLIFLKYISDKFEERYNELLADDDDVEDKDAYLEKTSSTSPAGRGGASLPRQPIRRKSARSLMRLCGRLRRKISV